MNNSSSPVDQNIEELLARLDKALSILVNDESMKEKIDKEFFYEELKLGDDINQNGVISTLYSVYRDEKDRSSRLASELEDLRSDFHNVLTSLTAMHKYLEDINSRPIYIQNNWHQMQITLSKYGVYG